MLRPRQEAFFGQTSRKKVATISHLWQKFASERLRFTSSVAEFTAATWTTGCRRNASSKKSTTGATMEGRRRNDLHINRIVLAIAKTFFTNKPRGKSHVENQFQRNTRRRKMDSAWP